MPTHTVQTLPALLNLALGHARAGRLIEAAAVYRRVLALDPTHAGAAYNLAVALNGLGRLDEAAAQYRRLIALRPDTAKAHNNLGIILAGQDKNQEAEAHYRQALAIQPDYANAHYNLANLLKARGAYPEAIAHYRRALVSQPDDADTHNNLGLALAADGQTQAAIGSYRRALALRPADAEAHNNIGSALMDEGRTEEAMVWYAKALALKPGYADAHVNMGHAFDIQDNAPQAEAQYERALALEPAHAMAHSHLGFLRHRLGRLDEALDHYGRAQAARPQLVDAHWNEALARLLIGDFATGWRKYEWRWRLKQARPRTLPAPLWDGGDLGGRTILLHAEQGQGDAIQFIRYAALVKARGGDVMLEAPAGLHRLLAEAPGVGRVVMAGAAMPAFDVHAPLLSLPRLFGTTLETIPAKVPYLQADAVGVEGWRARLAHLVKPKVGLVWRGNPGHENDRRRSIPAPVMARLTGARPTGASAVGWVSLQQGGASDEIAALSAPVFDAGPDLGDWTDTAALIAALDLVVTVDTAVAHLAGALGKPVWVLLPFAPDWRWLLDRSDSPWYPTMRLFRQPAPGDWESVLDDVRIRLNDLGAACPRVDRLERQ